MKITFLIEDDYKIKQLNNLIHNHSVTIVRDFGDIDIFSDLLVLDYNSVSYEKIQPYLISQYSPVNFIIVCSNHSDRTYNLAKMHRFYGFIDFRWQPVVIETAIENVLKIIENRSLSHQVITEASASLADDLYPFDPNTSGIVYYDAKGNILNLNPAAELMLGTKFENIKGLSTFEAPWQLINENGQVITWESHPVYQAIKTKKMVLNQTLGVMTEDRLACKWLQVTSIPIYNDKNEVNVVYSHLKDITPERALEEKVKIMAQAIEHSPIAILITDNEGNILSANKSFEEVSGYSESNLLGKNPRILKSPDSTIDYKDLWDTIKSGKVWTGEFVNINASGEKYEEEAVIAPVTNEHGIITHFVAMKEDITNLKRMKSQLESALSSTEQLVAERTATLKSTQNMTLEALAKLAEFRDHDTGFHIQRTKAFVRLLIENLHNTGYSDDEQKQIWQSAPLHDIGKVAITDIILLKKGPLTEDEFEIMKRHTLYGYKALIESNERQPYLKFAKEITLGHHEKWDGTGYPFGLKAEEIPLSARLMAIADVYDAMRSKRPYKEEMSHEKVVKEMLDESGRHFDPMLMDIFKKVHPKFKKIYLEMVDWH